jgi:CheY-like chemotaxis protein
MQPIRILLVDDNPADVRLTVEGLKEGGIDNELTVASDGVEALQILRGQGKHAGAPLPHLILLDLNLPKRSGQEVLADIKTDPSLRRIPTVVLTTSAAEEDVTRSYDLHANCYIRKPVRFDAFMTVIRSIENFWLTTVELPKGA